MLKGAFIEVFLMGVSGGDRSQIQKRNLLKIMKHEATLFAADQMRVELSSFRGRKLANRMERAKLLHAVAFGLVAMRQSVLQDRRLRLQI